MKAVIFIISFLALSAFTAQTDFLSQQKKYERVRTAYKDKGSLVTEALAKENIRLDDLNILLIAYKNEQQLDLFAKNKNDYRYKKILSYNICAASGQLGPKRKQGDYQVPEGFYHIDTFNPFSNFYLSLGLNYPNQSDRKKSKAANLGGDIFIHGDCVTIGCLPMTDDKIKEIYIYAIQARHSGQLKIPLYIFPFRQTDENMNKYTSAFKNNRELLGFWDNLKVGYNKFQKDLQELNVTVDTNGNYLFRQ